MDVSSTRNTIPLGREFLRLSHDTLHDFTWTLRDSLHTLHGLYMIVYILYVTLRGLT